MKIILGDNQFFGVNHFDLSKGESVRSKFSSVGTIKSFVEESLSIGLDGFMMNSNQLGYQVLSDCEFDVDKEIHYSVPYSIQYIIR